MKTAPSGAAFFCRCQIVFRCADGDPSRAATARLTDRRRVINAGALPTSCRECASGWTSIQSANAQTFASASFMCQARVRLVFDVRRHDIECDTVDQAVAFQPLQGLRQHPLAHAADGTAQFAESMRPALQNDQHKHAPATGDVLQDFLGRAFACQDIASLRRQHGSRVGTASSPDSASALRCPPMARGYLLSCVYFRKVGAQRRFASISGAVANADPSIIHTLPI